MSTMIESEIAAGPDVRGFMRRHNAEATYRKVSALVNECYPQHLGIEVSLRNDPDEEGLQKVLFYVKMPDMTFDSLMAQKDSYHERLVREVPLDQVPLFGVLLRFVA